ncbi:F-box domain-containing protein [Mycena indigotica]|uniref:F-box domain-containing protein n=1 Tax=Mycena indigotica TaxID=2126181 RepID=A0A8H6T1V3_9AGAR|nr:F-box domain-containing protein [Mycena indigotica]KAF7309501.1 F-box domain-containing protein [Mycena indigotica]
MSLPVDILLVVLKYLTLQDFVAFSQASKHFYEITQLRSVWLDLLNHHVLQRSYPIPRLDGRDPTQLRVSELQSCIIDALRLRRLWTAASPQPLQRRTFTTQNVDGLCPLTLTTTNDERIYTAQCWDISPAQPLCVARRRVSSFGGLRVNTDGSYPGVLALKSHNTVEILGIDFTAGQGFFAVQVLEDVTETLHVFANSKLLTKFNDQRLHLRDLQKPHSVMELRNSNFIEQRECLDALISDVYAVLIRTTSLEIYSITSDRPISEPLASHAWQWRIDSVSVNYQPSYQNNTIAPINLLVRYSSLFPWPVNALHHYVIPRNSHYDAQQDISPNNLPYETRPALIQSFASPIRLFARWDMVLGKYGTALWIDSHTEDYFANSVEGQRLAGVLFSISEDEGEKVDLRELVASSHASTVYDVREDDGWMRIAVDDEEGKIALGTTTGEITLLEYI